MSEDNVILATRTHRLPYLFNVPVFLLRYTYRVITKMKGDLRKLWGVLSGKNLQEQQRRKRSASLPGTSVFWLNKLESPAPKERRTSSEWRTNSQKAFTFPRRSKQKSRAKLPGRQRSISVCVEVMDKLDNEVLAKPQKNNYKRRGSTTVLKRFEVDLDESIKEGEALDIDELKRVLVSFSVNESETDGGLLSTTLCSTEL